MGYVITAAISLIVGAGAATWLTYRYYQPITQKLRDAVSLGNQVEQRAKDASAAVSAVRKAL